MRRRLILVTLAVTGLLVAAFAIPLGLLVRDVAHDRAVNAAEHDMAALVPVLAIDRDPHVVEEAVERTVAGVEGRLSAWLPDGTMVGDPSPVDADDLALARERGAAFSRTTGDGIELFTPVIAGDSQATVLRVRVPDDLLREGVSASWAILAGLAVVLIVIAVTVTDRLARTVTRSAAGLASTSRALAAGEATARVEVGGPPEIAAVGSALNALADRIEALLAAERERVADLSHRLRTPLTALRLSAEASGSPGLVADVDRLEAEISQVIRDARRPLQESVLLRCDLAAVARDRCAFWGALAADDGRPWTCAVPAEARLLVPLSEQDAAAALDVLLGNVFSHTPEGTAYEVGAVRSGATALLRVDDAGPGLPDGALLERGQSSAGSTGLGLDIAASTARSVGGDLRIGRSPLGGARVELELPLVEDLG